MPKKCWMVWYQLSYFFHNLSYTFHSYILTFFLTRAPIYNIINISKRFWYFYLIRFFISFYWIDPRVDSVNQQKCLYVCVSVVFFVCLSRMLVFHGHQCFQLLNYKNLGSPTQLLASYSNKVMMASLLFLIIKYIKKIQFLVFQRESKKILNFESLFLIQISSTFIKINFHVCPPKIGVYWYLCRQVKNQEDGKHLGF